MKAFSALLALILLVGCTSAPDRSDDMLLSADGALFRSVKMGDTADEIKHSEHADPVFLSDTLLQYTEVLAFNDREVKLTIYYSIDEYGLFEVQADYYTNETLRDELFIELEKKLNQAYGEHTLRFDSFRWTTPSASNTLIEISLSKELNENKQPFVSLNYLEPINEEL